MQISRPWKQSISSGRLVFRPRKLPGSVLISWGVQKKPISRFWTGNSRWFLARQECVSCDINLLKQIGLPLSSVSSSWPFLKPVHVHRSSEMFGSLGHKIRTSQPRDLRWFTAGPEQEALARAPEGFFHPVTAWWSGVVEEWCYTKTVGKPKENRKTIGKP